MAQMTDTEIIDSLWKRVANIESVLGIGKTAEADLKVYKDLYSGAVEEIINLKCLMNKIVQNLEEKDKKLAFVLGQLQKQQGRPCLYTRGGAPHQ